ncbi:hypothetical protein XELAEV_18016527mg [Xenopus laevis]|uniref:Uncharacterized protein n=1 Tax=Xenopus laevis TaxID=8355 RepID=A0A974DK20_XENLA|nr:hypothetical protein XELAEV_18016527mg [Xenopus laevis]
MLAYRSLSVRSLFRNGSISNQPLQSRFSSTFDCDRRNTILCVRRLSDVSALEGMQSFLADNDQVPLTLAPLCEFLYICNLVMS